jgi:hypothetical protein
MTPISGPMPADLAEAVRSLPCPACDAARAEYCPSDGCHLARWELAAATGLIALAHVQAAAAAARPAPRGLPPGLAVVPESSGVVCAAASHPLRWATQASPPQWQHLDPAAGQSCPAPITPAPGAGEPCRYHRRHWILATPAVTVAGTVPACQRCARKHARRQRRR